MPINPRQFLSEAAELHALVIGLGEIFPLIPPLIKAYDPGLLEEINSEYHYYMFGRALGILAWFGTSCAIKAVFF